MTDGSVTIEREYAPDREAMKSALRVVLGIPEPSPAEPQPDPVPNERPAVWDLVIEDMRTRAAIGVARYGTPLQPHNGRDALVDLYQELLDAAVYIRQVIIERDGR